MTELQHQLIATARRMSATGLNRGTAGNLSVRAVDNGEAGFLITPTGLAYETLVPEDIVFVALDGTQRGRCKPSSEWRFHRDLYCSRPEAGAIMHAHSPFATSLACLRYDIPAFHYMIARFGGDNVKCAKYATFGTQELSDNALAAMKDRCACLLANHGMLVFGNNLEQSFVHAIELEDLCEQYWRACQLGRPVLLEDDEMAIVLEKIGRYGQQDSA